MFWEVKGDKGDKEDKDNSCIVSFTLWIVNGDVLPCDKFHLSLSSLTPLSSLSPLPKSVITVEIISDGAGHVASAFFYCETRFLGCFDGCRTDGLVRYGGA